MHYGEPNALLCTQHVIASAWPLYCLAIDLISPPVHCEGFAPELLVPDDVDPDARVWRERNVSLEFPHSAPVRYPSRPGTVNVTERAKGEEVTEEVGNVVFMDRMFGK